MRFDVRMPATVMIQTEAADVAEVVTNLGCVVDDEIDIEFRVERHGLTIGTIALDGLGHLDKVDGALLEELEGYGDGRLIPPDVEDDEDDEDDELCRNEECREPLDGDGYDGECGSCADRTYAAEQGDDDETDEAAQDTPGALPIDAYVPTLTLAHIAHAAVMLLGEGWYAESTVWGDGSAIYRGDATFHVDVDMDDVLSVQRKGGDTVALEGAEPLNGLQALAEHLARVLRDLDAQR
ncbi:hypothetical protein ACFWBB_31040 [Streptomyces sp. NPDC060000]|uniref:hypothetical protein n=1 Tax=Streptomyces sp. NPDC060000 TaxID=3347031 RepID=UPI003674C148